MFISSAFFRSLVRMYSAYARHSFASILYTSWMFSLVNWMTASMIASAA